MEFLHQGFLDGCKAEYDAGNQYALMQAIWVCAKESHPIPQWAADPYIRGFEACRQGNAKSWDDVFGRPYAKGAQLNALMKRHSKQWPLVNRIREIRAADPTRALDENLFEEVGIEFVLSKTLVSDYYYDARKRAKKCGLW
jgi:hypothetical protein